MRIQKGVLFLVLLSALTILAACGQKGNPGEAPNNQGSGEEQPTAYKLIDKGEVVSKEGDHWLITAYVNKNNDTSIDAFWLTINEDTLIQNSGGEAIAAEDIAVGVQVEAWSSGEVRESYPGQGDAAKIVMLDEASVTPEDQIGQSSAIQAALQSQTEPSAARAVKSVQLDADGGIWKVELVSHEAMDQSITVNVDARSGQVVETPVAENDAFRIFAPISGTEASPGFVVEGEARVFEAAFSWTLEDGHNVLAEGHEMAEAGAPEWGHFTFEVDYEKASQPNMMLILYVQSAKDGSSEHQLIIPLKAPEEYINYNLEE